MADLDALSQAIRTLYEIVERLRGPNGCPWDRRQEMSDLLSYTKEEVAELSEAVETGKPEAIRDELADLLFHCLFYAKIAESKGYFDLTDVANHAVEKLRRRHPHVFSFDCERGLDDETLNRQWQAIKRKEMGGASPWIRWQPQLSALWGAWKLQQMAASWGFDWPEASLVFDKLHEEIGELKETIADNDKPATLHELGDVLFSVVNLARHLDVDPERALALANRRFFERVRTMCERIVADGKTPDKLSVEELDVYWEMAKRSSASHMPGSENQ
ncbi:MAG: nucleoside triphosphate pyrophosphohydrolase [Gammaproteobacteria bacterium]|nr:MAG: nucleoside triphosphate pyrophosphohydrolase [Gammaproteobacteria bacterium]